jgi:hypothetical protein
MSNSSLSNINTSTSSNKSEGIGSFLYKFVVGGSSNNNENNNKKVLLKLCISSELALYILNIF